jgi:lipoprotein-releasing system ATP-binding protein
MEATSCHGRRSTFKSVGRFDDRKGRVGAPPHWAVGSVNCRAIHAVEISEELQVPVPGQVTLDRPVCPVLEVVDLRYRIDGRSILDDAGLTVDAGESVAVMGPSGSGKSTFLSCILGLVRPDRGEILVDGKDVTRLRGAKLARYRHDKIGMVFQFGELIPELSPWENVALPALLSRQNRRSAYERAESLLEELNVPMTGRADRLSGGERQRAAVARALINSPDLIIADEPTGALDEKTRDQVAQLLFALPRKRNCALLLVTHDAAVAKAADRVVSLDQGTFSAAILSTVTTA